MIPQVDENWQPEQDSCTDTLLDLDLIPSETKDSWVHAGAVFDTSKYEEGSALELVRLAATKLPVPDYVMNDSIRAIDSKLVDEAMFLTLADGTYIYNIVAGVELREKEREDVNNFRAWVAENELFLPSGFTDDHNFDLRYL